MEDLDCPEESLLECLQDLVGQFQMNKIDEDTVVDTLKNIVAYEERNNKMKYKVLMNMSYGWDNIWNDSFDTIKEAHDQVEDLVTTTEEAFNKGDMSEAYLREDFKIVKLDTLEKDYNYLMGETL